ncbi:MAG: hypothetical protein D6767_07535 [Candidatus Hydrogenedentota bacterium]|nr:MAG: hypothetical protein D6767_07535 [Candidatus Hydrogenedentota bacterium]
MLYNRKRLEAVYLKNPLPKNYDGYICTFDLDKTYLATNFEKLSELIKIPFESAEEKINVPGAAALVRELRKPLHPKEKPRPIFFVTGSPQELDSVVREKFELDGVHVDGILYKNYRSAIRKLQFKKLVKSIGYKLGALLYARSHFPLKADELLFGDDSEYDAAIYSLYSDIIRGRLEDFEVMTILKKWDVDKDERDMIAQFLQELRENKWKPRDAVKLAFIMMGSGSKPQDYENLTSRLIPVYNHFQAALILYNQEIISKQSLFRIISELIGKHHFTLKDFSKSLEDLLARGLTNKRQVKRLTKILSKGNPFALPNRILLDVRTEFTSLLSVKDKWPGLKFRKKEEEESKVDFVKRYISFVPKRRISSR